MSSDLQRVSNPLSSLVQQFFTTTYADHNHYQVLDWLRLHGPITITRYGKIALEFARLSLQRFYSRSQLFTAAILY